MIVKINPADVVAIPTDYNNTKGRCCKYVVHADCVGYEAGQEFGALYRENPEVAFDDGQESNDDEFSEFSFGEGYETGLADAKYGLVRNAEEAYAASNEGDLNENSFIDGYNQGYDEHYSAAKVEVTAPKAKVVTRVISEATRAKLRKAAKRQKRDANGKYI